MIIDLIFNLFNLGIVLFVLGYGVKVYLLPHLREHMVKEHRDFSQLHDEHRHLIDEQKRIEDEIVEQEEHAKLLFKRVNQWRNVVDVSNQVQRDMHEKLRKSMEERAREGMRTHDLLRTYKAVAPYVVKNLEDECRKKFQDPREGHAYLSHILKKLSASL
jgi:biopolymer transport protein ExbB/TolQ